MARPKNRRSNVPVPRRPAVDLPTEVKLQILEEVGQLDPFTYRDLGLVWRDVLPAVRQVHFGHVGAYFRDGYPQGVKRVEKLRDLLLASPSLARSIEAFTIEDGRTNNKHKPVWQNPAVQLLQLLPNLQHLSLHFTGLDFRGSTSFEILAQLSRLESFSLNLCNCRIDINRVLQSVNHPSLKDVAIRLDDRVVLVTSKASSPSLRLEHLELLLDRRIGEWLSNREGSVISSVQTLTVLHSWKSDEEDVMFQLRSVVRGLQPSLNTLDLRLGPPLTTPIKLVSVIPPYTQSPTIQLGFSVQFWSPEKGRSTEWMTNVLSSLDPTVSITKLEVFLQFDSPVHPSSIPFPCTKLDSSHDTSESWKPIDRTLATTPAAIDHLVFQMLYFPDRNAKWRGSGNLAERAENWLFSVCLPLTKERFSVKGANRRLSVVVEDYEPMVW